MKPYYDEDGIQIFHGDCREVLSTFKVSNHKVCQKCKCSGLFLCDDEWHLVKPSIDLVLTDPPYPNMTGRVGEYRQCGIGFLSDLLCRQFIFWHSLGEFPLNYQAVHIWDKKVGCQSEYERIFERNSDTGRCRMFRHYLINSTVAAQYTGDTFWNHPSQKPIDLIVELLNLEPGFVLDPFMGSGTTLRAAKDLGRCAIGIEIEEKYCEIAAKRLSQKVFNFTEPTK